MVTYWVIFNGWGYAVMIRGTEASAEYYRGVLHRTRPDNGPYRIGEVVEVPSSTKQEHDTEPQWTG